MWLTLHVACALLSVSGFVLRGIWMLRGSPLLHTRAARVLPHVIDTLLLASALALMLRIEQYPFVHGWLTAKILAIVAYIVLGAVGLRYGKSAAQGCAGSGAEGRKTRNICLAAWLAALFTFGYIVAVALTRQPWPFSAVA